MSTVLEIAEYFERIVPSSMKMDFDNVGFLVGSGSAEVSRVLTALDATDDVIDEAASIGAQLILTHHPAVFSFEQMGKRVNDGTVAGERILRLLKNGISAICLHTNLDSVPGGVNHALAEKLGVKDTEWLEGPYYTADSREYGIGLVGNICEKTSMPDFLAFVKTALNANGLRYHDAGRPVGRVAVGGGSCGELLEAAAAKGCDTFVTADIKYDRFLAARELGINLIDADHFCTENVVIPVLADMLRQGFPELDVQISKTHKQTAHFFM